MGTSEHSSSYTYNPVGLQEIRLVELHRGTSNDIQVDIKHCSLDNLPPYEALSYCWGDTNDRTLIRCNGYQISITKSLYEALSQFRSTMDATADRRTIWADAICIDQSNLDERSQQVQLMGQIYRNARRVLVWLGIPDAKFREEFEFAALMFRTNRWLTPGIVVDNLGTVFFKLLSTPWFPRTWVVQEVALAKEASVIYGDTEISWDELVELCTKMHSLVSVTSQGYHLLSYLLGIERLRKVYHSGQSSVLVQPFSQLEMCRDRLATDPRDKVYALMGLFSFAPGKDFTIIPDYSEQNTKQAVFLDFAVKSLQSVRTLDLLSVPQAPSNDGLPSWAPKWDLAAPIITRRISSTILEYTGTLSVAGTPNFEPIFSSDNTGLRISGRIVDTIEEVGAVIHPPGQAKAILPKSEFTLTDSVIIYDQAMEITRANTSGKYFTGETLFDAHWKTMIAGAFRPDEEQDMRADFVQLRKLTKLKSKLDRLGLCDMKSVNGKRKYVGDVALMLFGGMSKRENRDRLWRRGQFDKPAHDTRSILTNRRFMRTKTGLIGLVPELAEVGDVVGVFEGGKVPLVLRSRGDDWELVGDGYVHGIMTGEAFVQEDYKEFWLR